MAPVYQLSDAVRNKACDAIVDDLDLNTPPMKWEIREGSMPAVGAASTGNLLATLLGSNPAFGNAGASNPGEAIAAAITSDNDADNSGTAGYGRLYQGAAADTAHHSQANAGDAGDTPAITFDNKVIVQGGVVAINTATITVPQG